MNYIPDKDATMNIQRQSDIDGTARIQIGYLKTCHDKRLSSDLGRLNISRITYQNCIVPDLVFYYCYSLHVPVVMTPFPFLRFEMH